MMRSTTRTRATCLAALMATSFTTWTRAAGPAVDRAGPLVARLEGPAVATRTDAPLPMRLTLESQDDMPLAVDVRVGLIDGWTARPAGPIRRTLAPRGRATVAFEVIPSGRSYDALYPIHVRARVVRNGVEHEAHPVHLVTTEGLARPRAVEPRSTTPYRMSADSTLALWQLPTRLARFAPRGRPLVAMPAGRATDPTTGASVDVHPQSIGGRRLDVVAIHPPWKDGRAGTTLAEFPLVLPSRGPIRLTFGAAVVDEGRGDGVTFRVRVTPADAPADAPGLLVHEQHSAARSAPEPVAVDLSRFAGRDVRLQLESDPGPKNDTGWDMSFWAEPTLVAGTPPPAVPFPPAGVAGSERIGTVACGSGTAEVRVWPGPRGLLDGAIAFEVGDRRLAFRGFEAIVDGLRIDDPRSPVALRSTKVERSAGIYRVRHEFEGPRARFALVATLRATEGVLRAAFALEGEPKAEPWRVVTIDDLAVGPWTDRADRVYAGVGNVVSDPGPFSLPFDGHRLATSFVGLDFPGGPSVVLGVDRPPDRFDVDPAAHRYAIHTPHASTLTIGLAPDAFEAVKRWRALDPRPPAPGVEALAGRFAFDLWGGRYADAAKDLRRSFRYGLGGGVVVWHNWQRWGYYFRLPDITPPNPALGTVDDMKDLVAACRASGTLFALHDNYIDAYPDADGFSYETLIAFHRDGTPVKAWFNEGRGAQSYRERPDRVEPFVTRNLSWIARNLAPSAYFLDVWSSIGPFDYWTADGRFVERSQTRDLWGETFDRIRETLGGPAPMISESGHDQLIGRLDGAQANHLRVGRPVAGQPNGWTVWDWRCADAERTPWIDAAHHDRFILHGAGYPGRYEGGLDPREHGIDSDDYLTTEVLTGHPGMVSRPFGHDVVRKHWLTNDLMRALALRRIEGVEYVRGDIHRQHVRWSGGGEVWVNRGDGDWTVAGQTLPTYGFYARVPTAAGTVEAAIVRRSGRIVEEARSPGRLYVNARGQASDSLGVAPTAADFEAAGGRAFRLDLAWRLDEPIPDGHRPFAHLCDDAGTIVAQADIDAAPLRARWERPAVVTTRLRGSLPADLAPGRSLELRVGLYNPATGARLDLRGETDRERRVRLGTLSLAERGEPNAAWSPRAARPECRPGRLNFEQQIVDFGAVRTAGGVRLEAEGSTLVVTPLPDDRERPLAFVVRADRLPWPSPPIGAMERVDVDGRVVARELVSSPGKPIAIVTRRGEFQYRLAAP